jgi:hypothetical protein
MAIRVSPIPVRFLKTDYKMLNSVEINRFNLWWTPGFGFIILKPGEWPARNVDLR